MTTSPFAVLLLEHSLHRRMLAVLDRIAARIDAGAAFPAADVARVLGYFREFGETVHHRREDEYVYALAMAHGDDRLAEAVGRLIADHEETRELLYSLTLFWEPGELLAEERRGFCAMARAYASRLRRHMDREERLLFDDPSWLPEADARALPARLAEVRGSRPGAEQWAQVLAVLEEHYP